MSRVQNVCTPTLLLIGQKDLRVPPAQAIYYYHALQEMKVDVRLLSYPEGTHSLLTPTETAIDSVLNSALWFDKYFGNVQ